MIAIFTAMPQEARAIVRHLSLEHEEHPRLETYKNSDGSVRLCVIGIGKVNAAIGVTDFLSQHPEVDFVINSGVAGALDPTLEVGDVVFAKSVRQHDFVLPEFIEKMSGIACNETIELQTLEGIPHTKIGTIFTGDQFVDSPETKQKLADLGGSVCDMECYSIAKLAQHFGAECAAVKSISDRAAGSANAEFEECLRLAIHNEVEAIEAILARKQAKNC